MSVSCRVVRRHVGAFVDGELDPATQIDFERHIESCASCQERLTFEDTFRVMVRESVDEVVLPEGFGERLSNLLSEEDISRGDEAEAPLVRVLPLRGRQVVPVAAAAVLALAAGIGFDRVGQQADDHVCAATIPLFEDVVRLHSSELPPDVADVPRAVRRVGQDGQDHGRLQRSVARYFRGKVEFPVRPAEFDDREVSLVGARLENIRDRRAAALYYDVRGRRMTLVVVDSPVVTPNVAKVRFGNREVFYQNVRGYTVPVRRHAGLTYVFTGDLDRQSLLQLAAAAHVD